ncbi:hypothetical protein C7S16_4354 [Burkholderia thailandensis]|uniref:Uncharacterized protein n=1 Tax=Burkholderia thailandensis TaxID=57975 RepID=A0AAW9CP11_BURTH|nr:hypothetical protein [Burkholderia thailandensis]MDW9251907.1 hypothetical protein [Burkholderia thailandensis]
MSARSTIVCGIASECARDDTRERHVREDQSQVLRFRRLRREVSV